MFLSEHEYKFNDNIRIDVRLPTRDATINLIFT